MELCGAATLELKRCTDEHPEYYGALGGEGEAAGGGGEGGGEGGDGDGVGRGGSRRLIAPPWVSAEGLALPKQAEHAASGCSAIRDVVASAVAAKFPSVA